MVVDRPTGAQVEIDDLANGTIHGRRGPVPTVGVLVVQYELPHVLNDPAGALEDAQRPAILHMVDHREVAPGHSLVAPLAMAGVVEATVRLPTVVVVVMLFPRTGIGGEEEVGRAAGWADAHLPATAVPVV